MTVQHINSESWCRKAYLNYHCYDNTMGLSPADMGEITQTWSHRLTSWQNSISSDETSGSAETTSEPESKGNSAPAPITIAGEGDTSGKKPKGKTV